MTKHQTHTRDQSSLNSLTINTMADTINDFIDFSNVTHEVDHEGYAPEECEMHSLNLDSNETRQDEIVDEDLEDMLDRIDSFQEWTKTTTPTDDLSAISDNTDEDLTTEKNEHDAWSKAIAQPEHDDEADSVADLAHDGQQQYQSPAETVYQKPSVDCPAHIVQDVNNWTLPFQPMHDDQINYFDNLFVAFMSEDEARPRGPGFSGVLSAAVACSETKQHGGEFHAQQDVKHQARKRTAIECGAPKVTKKRRRSIPITMESPVDTSKFYFPPSGTKEFHDYMEEMKLKAAIRVRESFL